MSKTQLFIEKARAVHGDLHNYGRSVYVRDRDKVIITCAKHGDFEQTPSNHLQGQGCAKCAIESTAAKKTQKAKNSFIERSRAVHGDKYDYLKAVYVGARDKVIITCKVHGDFEQEPHNHLRGYGCAKCSRESIAAERTQKAKDSFIERSRAVHGDKYDYLKTVYVRDKDKVTINCKVHGDFEQRPKDHLSGQGCAKCALESTAAKKTQKAKNSFIGKARAVHGDRYGYERVVYMRSKDKVVITCKQHGDFEQTPSDHLKGNGCPSCPARYDQPTNLYLMHNGLGKVKVGYSIDTDKRISELNRTAPFKAELLETWTLPDTPMARKIESKVHRKLAKYHAGLTGFDGATEWFNTTPCHAEWVINKAVQYANEVCKL